MGGGQLVQSAVSPAHVRSFCTWMSDFLMVLNTWEVREPKPNRHRSASTLQARVSTQNCMWACVCVYVRTYVSTYVSLYIYMYLSMCLCIGKYVYLCVCVSVYLCISAGLPACMHDVDVSPLPCDEWPGQPGPQRPRAQPARA